MISLAQLNALPLAELQQIQQHVNMLVRNKGMSEFGRGSYAEFVCTKNTGNYHRGQVIRLRITSVNQKTVSGDVVNEYGVPIMGSWRVPPSMLRKTTILPIPQQKAA